MFSQRAVVSQLKLLAEILAVLYILSAAISPVVLYGSLLQDNFNIITLISSLISAAVGALTAFVMLGIVYILIAIYEMLARLNERASGG